MVEVLYKRTYVTLRNSPNGGGGRSVVIGGYKLKPVRSYLRYNPGYRNVENRR